MSDLLKQAPTVLKQASTLLTSVQQSHDYREAAELIYQRAIEVVDAPAAREFVEEVALTLAAHGPELAARTLTDERSVLHVWIGTTDLGVDILRVMITLDPTLKEWRSFCQDILDSFALNRKVESGEIGIEDIPRITRVDEIEELFVHEAHARSSAVLKKQPEFRRDN